MPLEKILVIEDEALIARELKGRLTNMGWDVVGVAYGAKASNSRNRRNRTCQFCEYPDH